MNDPIHQCVPGKFSYSDLSSKKRGRKSFQDSPD